MQLFSKNLKILIFYYFDVKISKIITKYHIRIMGSQQSHINSTLLKKLKSNDENQKISICDLLRWIDSLSTELINNTASIDSHTDENGLIHWIYNSSLSDFVKYNAIVLCIAKGGNPFKTPKICGKDIPANTYFCNRKLANYNQLASQLDNQLYQFIVEYFADVKKISKSHNEFLICCAKTAQITQQEMIHRYTLFITNKNPVNLLTN
jgi:hypothetical protein